MDRRELNEILASEMGLDPVQIRMFLLVTCGGRMTVQQMSSGLAVSEEAAASAAESLVSLGAFIEMSGEFEAMHPRFTAVSMYRRRCESRGVQPARNRAVDSVGTILEGPYDDARTK